MWILPKNYPLSSRFAQDMVESKEDLTLRGLNIESSLMWRSRPSLLRTWSTRWKQGSYLPHLFTRILKPSQRTSFETALTSSLEVIRASRFQQQDSEREPMTQDTCGHLYGDTLNQLDLFSASLKTSRDTYRLDSPQSSAIWKKMVTEQRGEYSQRVKSAHLTRESESTSWATPRACSAMAAQITENTANAKYPNLETQVAQDLTWATPNTMDYLPQRSEEALARQATTQRKGRTRPANLREQVNPIAVAIYQEPKSWPTVRVSSANGASQKELQAGNPKRRLEVEVLLNPWPTPTAHLGKEGAYPAEYTRKTPSLTAAAMESEQKPHSSGHLNPEWVEWLMGVPTGWTGLDSWETE